MLLILRWAITDMYFSIDWLQVLTLRDNQCIWVIMTCPIFDKWYAMLCNMNIWYSRPVFDVLSFFSSNPRNTPHTHTHTLSLSLSLSLSSTHSYFYHLFYSLVPSRFCTHIWINVLSSSQNIMYSFPLFHSKTVVSILNSCSHILLSFLSYSIFYARQKIWFHWFYSKRQNQKIIIGSIFFLSLIKITC